MKTKTHLFLLLLFCCPQYNKAQSGFFLPSGVTQLEIPFDYVNNFIIITLTINGAGPVKMIFDTGAEYTILSKKDVTDYVGIKYDREFKLVGADLKSELTAYLARKVRLETAGFPFVAPREDILVLAEDYFRFEEYAGVNVHGILSGQSFSRYMFKINYQRHVITLYDREYFKPEENGFQRAPVELFRNKIYLYTNASFRANKTTPIKLLLDTGAAVPLLLFTNIDSLIQPPETVVPSNIGMGLGGYLEGFVGRVEGLQLGSFYQNGIITFFQAIDTTKDLTYLNNRKGLVGNLLLSRFQVLFDYPGGAIWLKPTKEYKDKYVFDRSGIMLIAGGKALNQFTVQSVIPGSPGDEAGILPGDLVLRVGFIPHNFIGLSDIQKIFQKRPGKKIRLIISRNNKTMKKKLVLRDLI